MPLTVLNVAFPFASVGPDAVGGAEQVLAQLDEALVRAAENSLVLACAGSKVRGTLFPHPIPDGVLDPATRQATQNHYRGALQRILSEHPVDLVHMHGIDFSSYFPETNVPVLVTLHLPLDWYPPEAFALRRAGVHFHCVSASQRQRVSTPLNLLPDIENGVPVERFLTRARRRELVTALGRICPEKGFHHALDAARRAGVPMMLAGRVFPYLEHQSYFDSEIRPRLSVSRRFIGPVGFQAKKRLLASSRCLLISSLVPETSSLVAMEALACGTPVIAFPSGALADIVEDGLTGFLVENEREMAKAITRVDQLHPDHCRARAQERFSAQRTTAAYLEAYRRLAASQPATANSAVRCEMTSVAA